MRGGGSEGIAFHSATAAEVFQLTRHVTLAEKAETIPARRRNS